MTPERARLFARACCDDDEYCSCVVHSIIAACAEERRAAMTEAIEACEVTAVRGLAVHEAACEHCAAAISALRDGEATSPASLD